MNECGWWKELDSHNVTNQYSIVRRKKYCVIHVLNKIIFLAWRTYDKKKKEKTTRRRHTN